MTRTIAAGVAFVPLTIAAACSSFSQTAEPVDAGAPPDASVTPIDAPDTDATLDAGDTADVFDGCTPLIDDDFTKPALDPSWIIPDGGHTPVVGFGEVILLDQNVGGAGAAMWHAAVSPANARLRIQVELHITPVNDGIADGMSIAWAPAKANGDGGIKIGGGSSSLGICPNGNTQPGPAGALALGLETFIGFGSPRHLEILDQMGNGCAYQQLPAVTLDPSDAGSNPVSIEIIDAQLTGTFGSLRDAGDAGDGIVQFAGVLPRTTDVAWIGFGAGSGAGTARQAIAHVHVSSCQ